MCNNKIRVCACVCTVHDSVWCQQKDWTTAATKHQTTTSAKRPPGESALYGLVIRQTTHRQLLTGLILMFKYFFKNQHHLILFFMYDCCKNQCKCLLYHHCSWFFYFSYVLVTWNPYLFGDGGGKTAVVLLNCLSSIYNNSAPQMTDSLKYWTWWMQSLFQSLVDSYL